MSAHEDRDAPISLAMFFEDVAAPDATPPEERYVPVCEPFLSEWSRLHSLHVVALAHVDADQDDARCSSLRAAVHLADAKYRLYCDSLKARRPDVPQVLS